MPARRWLLLIALCCAALWPAPAVAAIIAWLDYNNFETRLGELATSAGVTPFDGAEVALLKSGIGSQLQTAYSGFEITFSAVQPAAPYERLRFGVLGGGGELGEATRIDVRNQFPDDVAQVYTAGFSFILDEFNASDNRSEQLRQLTTAIAGTAAHELAHNLGLMHADAYSKITFNGHTPVLAGGGQNSQIMATGTTGLSELQRETERTFSQRSLAKLEYADGLRPTTPASLAEQPAAHNTWQTAQPLSLTALSISGLSAVNVVGALTNVGEFDFYSFFAPAGTRISVDTRSEVLFADWVDTFITLFDRDGVTDLAHGDDTAFVYSTNDVFGAGFRETTDSVFYNILLPEEGTYFLKVNSPEFTLNLGRGDYELFLTADLPSAPPALAGVPEPSSALLTALLALCAFAARRRAPGG